MQLDHYTTPFKARTFPITLICDHVSDAANIGSLFRIADAFGVQRLIFCGANVTMGRKMTRTSRATEKVIPFEVSEDAREVIGKLKKDGVSIIALEITNTSMPLHKFQISKEQPVALIVGAERYGTSDAVLNLADTIIHIEMFGQNSSMNVVQAANIALYEISRQLM